MISEIEIAAKIRREYIQNIDDMNEVCAELILQELIKKALKPVTHGSDGVMRPGEGIDGVIIGAAFERPVAGGKRPGRRRMPAYRQRRIDRTTLR